MEHGARLVAHCALESYSVLTRLPPPHRVPARLVVEFLSEGFTDDPLALPAPALHALVPELHERGIEGGSVYDGLVALSAAAHGATLLTLDRRAVGTYRRCAVETRLIA